MKLEEFLEIKNRNSKNVDLEEGGSDEGSSPRGYETH